MGDRSESMYGDSLPPPSIKWSGHTVNNFRKHTGIKFAVRVKTLDQ
jgi:hypothetical protein